MKIFITLLFHSIILASDWSYSLNHDIFQNNTQQVSNVSFGNFSNTFVNETFDPKNVNDFCQKLILNHNYMTCDVVSTKKIQIKINLIEVINLTNPNLRINVYAKNNKIELETRINGQLISDSFMIVKAYSININNNNPYNNVNKNMELSVDINVIGEDVITEYQNHIEFFIGVSNEI